MPEFSTHIEQNLRPQITEADVLRALEVNEVPKNTFVIGGLPNFVLSLHGLPPIYAEDGRPILSIAEYEAILKAISSHGAEFLGPNILPSSSLGSATLPGASAQIAELPYPQTGVILNGEYKPINHGQVQIGGITEGFVSKAAISSGGNGVKIYNTPFNNNNLNYPDYTIIQARIIHTDTKNRPRDTRIVFHPILGYLTISDRLGEEGAEKTNVAAGANWVDSSIKLKKIPDNVAYANIRRCITETQNGMPVVALMKAYGVDKANAIMALYQSINLEPHMGMYGYDLIFPNAQYPDTRNASTGAFPFVNETHHFFALPDNCIREIVHKVVKYIENNGFSSVVFPIDNMTGIMSLIDYYKTRRSIPAFIKSSIVNATYQRLFGLSDTDIYQSVNFNQPTVKLIYPRLKKK